MLKSQEQQILKHLQRFGSIEPLTALRRFGCFRLGARIWDLRHAGHRIDTVTVRKGRKAWARYVMQS